jgi:hypothetical protein
VERREEENPEDKWEVLVDNEGGIMRWRQQQDNKTERQGFGVVCVLQNSGMQNRGLQNTGTFCVNPVWNPRRPWYIFHTTHNRCLETCARQYRQLSTTVSRISLQDAIHHQISCSTSA